MSIPFADTAFDALCEPERPLDVTDLTAAIRRLPVDRADLQALIATLSCKCVDVRDFDLEATIEHLDAAFKSLDAAPVYTQEQSARDEAYADREMRDADARVEA